MALDETIAKHLESCHCGESRAVTSRKPERAFDIRAPDLQRVKKIAHAERGLTKALDKLTDNGQITFPLEGGDVP